MFSLAKILKLRKSKPKGASQQKPRRKPAAKKPRKPRLSIVSAVYNMEAYLDAFLESIVKQKAGLDVLEVILVNDGSRDGTQAIMDRWSAEHPKLIRTLTIENGGVANARNRGLELAQGQWITFCDPDDFLSENYLAETLAEIDREGKGKLVAVTCNVLRYIEEHDKVKDDHPLRHRFRHQRRRLSISKLSTELQLSVCNVWMRTSIIRKASLAFKDDIRPTFEDAFFFSEYLLNCDRGAMAFLKGPKYYYRKRAIKNSHTDSSPHSREWYTSLLQNGAGRLLRLAQEKKGIVPVYFRNLVIYDLFWRFKDFLYAGHHKNVLNTDDLATFIDNSRYIFKFIDQETIEGYSLAGLYEEHRVGLWSLLKQKALPVPKAYIVDHDRLTNKARILIHAPLVPDYEIVAYIDGTPVRLEDKKVIRRMAGPFDYRDDIYCWVDLSGGENLSVSAGGSKCELKIGGTHLGDFVQSAQVSQLLRNMPRYVPSATEAEMRATVTSGTMRQKFGGCFLLMDRDTKADDNAEHVYRYLLRQHLDHKCFFVLREDSTDWPRLKDEGFKLVAYGSTEHIAALGNASVLLSSHVDHYVFWPIERRALADLCNYEFVFLQHGVTTSDVSRWLNSKPIRGLVTAAEREAASFARPGSPYKYNDREIWLTGFPRHDALLEKMHVSEGARHAVLIAPTWRQYLTGQVVEGYRRQKNPLFLESDYLREWSAVLSDSEFVDEVTARGGQLVFAPHPGMRMYIEDFGLDPRVELQDVLTLRYPDLVRRCQSIVTDYSSVASEFAYLDKPVTYFHFDRERVFSGGHVYTQGYFNFDVDGFGPVYRHADDVKAHILSLLDGGEDPSYSLRRRGFFRYHDGKASQRVAERMFEVAGCLMRPDLSVAQAEALLPRLLAEGRTDEAIRLSQHVLDTGKSASPAFREALLNGLAEGSDQREFNRRVVQWLSYAMRMEDEIVRLREQGASSVERSADHHAKA